MPTTPDDRFGISVDVLSDGPPDGPHVFYNELVQPITSQAALYDQGTFALRPVSTVGTPGKEGRFYMVVGDTDKSKNGILWYDYGTGWLPVAFGSVEIDSQLLTSSIAITGGGEATATTLISGHSVPYDGSRVHIEAWSPHIHGGAENVAGSAFGVFCRDGVSIGYCYLGRQTDRGSSGAVNQSQMFDVPPAGNHVYSFRGWRSTSAIAWVFEAGLGGVGNYLPAFLRVTKA